MKVIIHVDPVLALREDKPTGDQEIDLSDQDLATLTKEERLALADALEDGHMLGKGYRVVSSETGRAAEHEDVRVADSSLGSLKAILSARAEMISRESKIQESIKAAAGKWIKQYGTDQQRARWTKGSLAATEIRDLARARLFAPLSSFPRMRRLKPSEVCSHELPRSSCKCSQDPAWAKRSRVNITVKTLRSLRETKSLEAPRLEQYRDQIKRIKAGAPKGAQVEIIEVRGDCSGCSCNKRRYGVLVTVDWEGVPLSLRYALITREDKTEGKSEEDED